MAKTLTNVKKVLYLKEADELDALTLDYNGERSDIVQIKNSIDGDLLLIEYSNGILIEVHRSNVIVIYNK